MVRGAPGAALSLAERLTNGRRTAWLPCQKRLMTRGVMRLTSMHKVYYMLPGNRGIMVEYFDNAGDAMSFILDVQEVHGKAWRDED